MFSISKCNDYSIATTFGGNPSSEGSQTQLHPPAAQQQQDSKVFLVSLRKEEHNFASHMELGAGEIAARCLPRRGGRVRGAICPEILEPHRFLLRYEVR